MFIKPIKMFMKTKLLIFTLLSLIVPSVIATTIPAGTWSGEISVSANQVPLIFHIAIDEESQYTATMDSPAQGANGIPVKGVKVTGDTIILNIAAANAIFDGEFDAQSSVIKGTWKQGSHSFPLTLQQKNEDVMGLWRGKLQGTSVNLSIDIIMTEKNKIMAYLSPNDGISKVEVSNLVNKKVILSFEVPAEGVKYTGIFNQNNKEIVGVFSQGGREFALNFTKSANSQQVKLDRPQHPKKPYTYNSEGVVFENKAAQIKLSGTLTTPKGKGTYPAVVLISGSGPQDRDQTFMGHKTFLVLADHLTKSGIAVLRFDDRGVADSTGDFTSATSLDFASDVQAAVEFLVKRSDIDASNIGLIGHSEGGLIAPIVANQSSAVAFMALMAGPGVSGNDIAVEQIKTILAVNGLSAAAAKAGSNITRQLNEVIIANLDSVNFDVLLTKTYQNAWSSLSDDIQTELKKVGGGSLSSIRIKTLSSAWHQYFLTHQPEIYLSKTSIPVMAIHGSKDKQMNAAVNLAAIKSALPPSTKHLVIEINGLNHLFQTANTGLMSEYSKIPETIAPQVLNKISRWILEVATK